MMNDAAPTPSRPRLIPILVIILVLGFAASLGGTLYYRGEVQRLQDELMRQQQLPPPPPLAQPQPPAPPPAGGPLAPDDAKERAARLERQVAELNGRLAARDQELDVLRRRDGNRAGRDGDRPRRDRGEPRPGQGPGEFMQRLRENDPQRYQEMQTRIKEFNDRMTTALGEQEAFLSTLDAAAMSAEQQNAHTRLLAALQRMREINEQLSADPEAADVPDLRREMFENMTVARDLLAQERQTALQDLARQLGYREQETSQFADYVNQVYESTSLPMGRMGGPRGGRTPGGAPDGAPPPGANP
ncbi:MAG: hypothetical protein BWZ02_01673 [Lentisphaerae bacterium ADurb.BinA184]|nr:MAG: hypothetical protein BWZ02_01673 [Lentisphaerae bacterium ADurb.BinA184]